MAEEVRAETKLVRAEVLIVALLLCGCKAKKPAEATITGSGSGTVTMVSAIAQPVCPAEAFNAVLKKVMPVLDLKYGELPPQDEAGILAQEAKIACIRDWAESLADPCIKSNYVKWLDHYARQAHEWRDDLSKKVPIESDQAKRDREYSEKALRIAEYERHHPVPKPPSCDIDLIRRVKP